MKLQQQKMHLGPPPLVLPVRRPEDPGGGLEDDSCPEVSGADVTSQGVFSKVIIHLTRDTFPVFCMVNQLQFIKAFLRGCFYDCECRFIAQDS